MPLLLKKDESLQIEEQKNSRLNTKILERICQYIEIPFSYQYFSKMNLELVNNPGDWALQISKALQAKEYVNPPGVADIFNQPNFVTAKIKLTIRQLPQFEYSCKDYDFLPHLSIIDILMWNSPAEVKKYLNYKLF